MQRAHRCATSLVLAAALTGPMLVMASPKPEEAKVEIRVYDRSHKDYHNWDSHENERWKVYLSNNHRRYHEYTKADKREQEEYWNWRHAHPDEHSERR